MYKLISLILLWSTFMSCDFGMEEYHPGWGLRSIELRQELEFREQAYTHEILFEPRISSKKYELRLFYPLIDPRKWTYASFDTVEANILGLLDGFKYTIYDLKTHEVVKQYTVDFSNRGFRGHSFNINTPLSLWAGTKINLKKKRKYRIVLNIPPEQEAEEMYSKVVFVVGIAMDTFL